MPVRRLQQAAREAAAHVGEGVARRVVVFDEHGKRVLDLAIPLCCAASVPAKAEESVVVAGWSFSEKGSPLYDGKPVAVAASRWNLLRVLVEADGPTLAKDFVGSAFDRETSLDNVKYHIKELRRELAKAFPGFEGEVIAGDADGYRLAMR